MHTVSDDFKHFVTHLRLEALALAVLMAALTYVSNAPLWVLLVSFPFFDIGMVGYALNPKLGAKTYNFVHDATIPTFLITFGVLFDVEWLSVLGFAWTFHIAVDRLLGFGLKHKHSFNQTHLGKIGKK